MRSITIIGGGLGGLSCGVILAKNGYKVTVLEQNQQIGGCLQCFCRNNHKFETGMHFIGSVAENQPLHAVWKFLELNDVKLSSLESDNYDVFRFRDDEYSLPFGKDKLKQKLQKDFPENRAEIYLLWSYIEKVVNNSSLRSITGERFPDADALLLGDQPLGKILDDTISNKKLQNAITGNIPLYAGIRDVTPFSIFAFIIDFYQYGAYRIVGGSDNIAKSLKNTIEKYGGRVIANQKVVKITDNNNKIDSLICSDGNIYSSDDYIFAIHPKRFLELTDSKLIRKAYRERVADMRQTVGTFSVYLQFKDDTLPYMNHNFYSYKDTNSWNCEDYSSEDWPKGYLYMHFCDEENQKYAKSGVILSYMNFKDVEKWKNTKIAHRGADYEKFKQDCAKKLLKSLENDFPCISKSIAKYYASTPLTYLDYTGTEAGSMYGIMKQAGAGATARVSHRTKFENGFLAGQNINSHGFQGVLIGTLTVCTELLRDASFLNQIINNE